MSGRRLGVALAMTVLPALLVAAPAGAATKPVRPNTIAFWNSERGLYGAGDAYFNSPGKISLTTDGGETFRTVLRTDGGVVWLETAGAMDAWAVVQANSEDHYLLHSGDGGLTWRQVLPYVRAWQPSFASPLVGLAVAGGDSYGGAFGSTRFLATKDGGATWERQHAPCRSDAELAVTTLASPDRAWAVCGLEAGVGMQAKMVYRTTDGGQHWQRLVNVKFGGCDAGMCSLGYPYGLSFSHGFGFMWQDYDFGYVTRTGGRHWSLARDVRLAYSASMVSRHIGFVLTYQRHGVRLLRTDDAGRSWSDVHHWRRKRQD